GVSLARTRSRRRWLARAPALGPRARGGGDLPQVWRVALSTVPVQLLAGPPRAYTGNAADAAARAGVTGRPQRDGHALRIHVGPIAARCTRDARRRQT